MIITFLGTGTSQGVPVIGCDCPTCSSIDFRDKRLRTSIHLQTEDLSLIFDTGPDFRQQVLREKIRHVDAVLFTHQHKDHTAGLDDIRSFNFLQGEDIPIYGKEEVLDQIKQEFSYAFSKIKYPGIPQIKTVKIENEPFEINGERIIPIQVFHHKLPVFGFRIRDFTYITDANKISEEELEKAKGSKVVVLNALQETEHLSHYTRQEAVDILQELAPEKGYLIHLSHRMGTHRTTEAKLPDFIKIAYDGLKIKV